MNGKRIKNLAILLLWLILLVLILANDRTDLLWVYLLITAVLLIIGAVSHEETAGRNRKQKSHPGAYAGTERGQSGVQNGIISPGVLYGSSGKIKLYNDAMNNAAETEKQRTSAD